MGKIIQHLIFALFLIFILGCSTTQQEVAEQKVTEPIEEEEAVMNEIPTTEEPKEEIKEVGELNWRDIEIKDINSGDSFKISDFTGKTVLLESFAVWCPTCTRQQNILKEMGEEEDIIHVSLDTDPNEDEEAVREHTQRNGFDWRYAISPAKLTKGLIDEFGVGVVNAPGAPLVLICHDQSARMLKRGVKSADFINGEIAKGCAI